MTPISPLCPAHGLAISRCGCPPVSVMAATADRGVMVYSSGLVACSVCAPSSLTLDEVEAITNMLNPTGISSPWRVSSEPTFHGGGEQPGPCDQSPAERIHYLMEC